MPPVTALIADDERLMREQLTMALARVWPELQVVAEARDGAEAVELARRHRPDLAFLDITMPVQSGLAAAVELDGACPVVFVTAYDQYAIKAFEEGAVDYLLKPVEDDRLERTRQRWQQRQIALPPQWQDTLRLLGRQLEKPNYLRWIRASVGNSLRMISIGEVLFFQSDEKYTRVQTVGCEALIRMPIKELLPQLDPEEFWQIHRATLVRVDAIDQVRRDERGLLLELRGHDQPLEVSRSYAHLFQRM
ncbi:LytTR family DNA-binding domain-containing protein [Chromobacterium subtsugae]|uniref:LytTR family DNA-binding domain-containing protein n=1 Tax=Chromobacterium subtsugae TaxID=251747 RepID=A0ABS7FBF5_9NEIS|nr:MULTISPECIES: LytTR family DNA-binding domain-containing protein [Chromobacterium]KUM05468.1 transcriptional regulator [Chromobacterium subtsugae]KZE87862.1 two-component system response regulator [Chromobacterium sp. F49]MBW7565354.1 response regulator transcription factor [Chromobacterium subtsugae]MBW8286795.1 LytTR family DNA-binding domain-containing protein [Chromobacterium subtsugae]OBU86108.1 transcriptional regulator [Chromobacterium subtsugae]